MSVLRFREAAQVTNHHQRYCSSTVDMEQVVLHLPDDAAEPGR
jgi:hypothetical protein